MDSSQYAIPGCPICGGTGTFTIREEGSVRYALCQCTFYTQRKQAAQLRVDRLFPGRAGQMIFSTYDPGGDPENKLALKAAQRFVDQWHTACEAGWILGFSGQPRSGKTHLANAIAIELVNRYFINPYLLSVPRMLRMERERFNQDDSTPSPIELASNADLLVLDDLGAEYRKAGTPGSISWVDEQLYLILDERIMFNRPTVYTSNLSAAQLATSFDEAGRVAGRLMENQIACLEMQHVPGVNGPSEATKQAFLQ